MPQFTLRILLLWTCLCVVAFPSTTKASALPPVLNNPSGCNLGLPIKDFSCDASHFFQINVANAPGLALGQDVYLKEVRLIIDHDWAADLDITLISPNDAAINLSSDNGSGKDDYGNPDNCSQPTIFVSGNTMGACMMPSIQDGSPPFIGSFLPEQNFMSLHDGTDPNGIWTLRICDDGKEHEGTLEFVELVFGPTTCLNPTEVEVASVDSTSVLLNWIAGSHCDSTIIEFGSPIGFPPGIAMDSGGTNSFVIIDSCPPVRVYGLAPSSSYEIYLREKCANGFSINSCPVTFSTTCSPPPVTLKEDFNSQINCTAICGAPCSIVGLWRNSLVDNFDWIVSDKDNITTTGTGPSDDSPGGGKYIYIESSQSLCRSGREGALVSNCMRVKASADSCDMSFDYLLNGVHVNALKLEYKELDSTEWKLLESLEGNLGPKWVTKFIDLDQLNGKSVQFRFLALGGNGNRGDVALDNIVFYGSEDLGPPAFTYYADYDEDGYGGQAVYFSTCQFQSNTPGFVPNNLDCDDDNPFIHPNAVEFPCDGFDSNCNGMADDSLFAPPVVSDTTICSGVQVPFKAIPRFGGQIHWFNDSTNVNEVFIGTEYHLPNFPSNYTSDPITLTMYAQELVNGVCFSLAKSVVNITILPQPDINTTDSPEICAGELFNLSTIDVIDNNGANGIITYHSANPPELLNEIGPNVFPVAGDTFYIASTPDGGCTDVVAIPFIIKPSPIALIQGQDAVCKNTAQILTAQDVGNGIAPLSYNWNTGDTVQSISASSHPLLGGSSTYIMDIESANGCSDSDTMTISTINNINSVQRIVTDVTLCDGNDGSIELTPLDGIPPYTFDWGNGMSFTGNNLLLQNLAQGAYSFTITDGSPQQCEFVIPLMTVNGPGAVVASAEVIDVSCNGGNDGAITLNINGNNPIIIWQNGATSPTLTGLTAGIYTAVITDGDCENILEFEIKQPDKITVNPTVTEPTCAGEDNASIFLNVFGGTPPYQYDWENGITTQSFNNIPAGTYAVTITDSKDCFQELPALMVNEPKVISYDTTAFIQPTCFGFQDGKISIKPNGGTGPYDVDWSNGAMGTTINSLSSGTYMVTIEDANGCMFTQPFQLNQPPPMVLTVDALAPPVCKGQDNGSISISVQGGTGNYSYAWNNNMTDEDIDSLLEGDYYVSITDDNGCFLSSDAITLIGPELISISATIANPPCIGLNNGALSVEVTNGGNMPFSFNWSTDEPSNAISNLSPGEYIVTVTNDQTGCQIDSTFYITTQQVLSLNVETVKPACHGSADGQIYLNASGGTAPLVCSWGDVPDNNCSRTLLTPANYAATITDANGCKINTDLIVLENPPPIEVELQTLDVPTCYGDSTGIISVEATGGTGNLNYQWSNGLTIPVLSRLGEGQYHLTVFDENNCSENFLYEINWPPPITTEEERFIRGCNTLDSVCVITNGGVAPYTYDWSHGDSVTCLKDVPIGDYSVTITDDVGCSEEVTSIKVPEEVEPMYLQQMDSNDSICFGQNNGEITISIEGGSLPYQYIWEHGVTGSIFNNELSLTNLPLGGYQVTITDSEGCTSSSPWFFVEMGSKLIAQTTLVENVNCKQGTDGSIDISILGSYPPYQVVWTNNAGDTVSVNQNPIGLPAGEYYAQITDTQGCSDQLSEIITEPSEHLGLDTFFVTPVTCFEDQDGEIDIFPMGGTPPYAYDWSNLAITQNVSDLSVGSYTLLMTDANDCLYQNTILVDGPDAPLSLSYYEIQMPECNGESNGQIEIEIVGGTSPYTFDWGVSNDEDLSNITAGQYFLTVYDNTLECLYDTVFEVLEPPLLVADTSSTPSTGISDGSATVDISGGTPPYHILWETDDTTRTINNLTGGWYEFVVLDANSCLIEGGVLVNTIIAVIDREKVSSYTLGPNPTSGFASIDLTLHDPLDLEMQVFNALGEIVLSDFTEHFNNGVLPIDLNNLPAGLYYISLKSREGHFLSDRIFKY